jgi:L-alanine-DL-glutamate epimerase-like enolase superfamily enzyme
VRARLSHCRSVLLYFNRHRTNTTPQLGERLFTRTEFRPYFEAGVVDIVQPDLAHAGGISEVKRIANMAEYVRFLFLIPVSFHFLGHLTP